ncbi:hypothetical protein GCM10007972_08860 [Iodidimonas muriae]|uniref:Flagellar hook-length control protein FliK n=1 Tax=Iodidimonas muriae TaxID=261467 RepID=A0ABQ2LAB0_9PROT|nr:hypothetical protein [Iodidimonas muriae]GER06157.1 hypothetical protein JCM17843_04670 [Kordiimonadales bacterium JCM 17843]GGO08465.1 hypothetical protein GCM10007972_08860 [Iodidimonas muriae]
MASPTPLSALLAPLTKAARPDPQPARTDNFTRRNPEEPTSETGRADNASTDLEIDQARQDLSQTLAQFGREAVGRPSEGPAFQRLGQIIDIRV